ncbi:hypothetical protein TRFO_29871 [Tritrichomonas foetus]|uniref:Lecithin:cholesterol acyltransferase family protein n=1 Tax=Tritrichomonas foetus TaxID=1144522 RepID=A0A1J4K085_9EUKA|nr:hypothetical protein TRFO_29871 [Tritrichomonas foetus]|eukprot:OHT02925.1 hypothetical protein TRFO_29871 [Tritrichomonas foetus]
MMFLFLVIASQSSKPVFFAPGMMSSPLYGTITDKQKFPECIDFEINNSQIWPIQGNMTECVSKLLDAVYHPDINSFNHPDGVSISTLPITKKSPGRFLDWHDNVYTVYYDWSLYFLGLDTLFNNLKNAIEVAVNESNEKAILMGHSLGTNFMRYFSTFYSSKEWLQQYVDGIHFLAPGVQGTFTSVIYVIKEYMGPMEGIFVKHMSSQWAMFPNFPLYKGCIERDGEIIDASQIYDEMIKANLTDETTDAIYDHIQAWLSTELQYPGIRTSYTYNTGIPVQCGVKIHNSETSNMTYEAVYCGGDGALEANGAIYACQTFKDATCHDFNSTDESKFGHVGMLNQDEMIEVVKAFIQNHPDDKNWFSGTVKYVIIGISCAVVLIIIVLVVICVVKKKKNHSNQYNNLNDTLQ